MKFVSALATSVAFSTLSAARPHHLSNGVDEECHALFGPKATFCHDAEPLKLYANAAMPKRGEAGEYNAEMPNSNDLEDLNGFKVPNQNPDWLDEKIEDSDEEVLQPATLPTVTYTPSPATWPSTTHTTTTPPSATRPTVTYMAPPDTWPFEKHTSTTPPPDTWPLETHPSATSHPFTWSASTLPPGVAIPTDLPDGYYHIVIVNEQPEEDDESDEHDQNIARDASSYAPVAPTSVSPIRTHGEPNPTQTAFFSHFNKHGDPILMMPEDKKKYDAKMAAKEGKWPEKEEKEEDIPTLDELKEEMLEGYDENVPRAASGSAPAASSSAPVKPTRTHRRPHPTHGGSIPTQTAEFAYTDIHGNPVLMLPKDKKQFDAKKAKEEEACGSMGCMTEEWLEVHPQYQKWAHKMEDVPNPHLDGDSEWAPPSEAHPV